MAAPGFPWLPGCDEKPLLAWSPLASDGGRRGPNFASQIASCSFGPDRPEHQANLAIGYSWSATSTAVPASFPVRETPRRGSCKWTTARAALLYGSSTSFVWLSRRTPLHMRIPRLGAQRRTVRVPNRSDAIRRRCLADPLAPEPRQRTERLGQRQQREGRHYAICDQDPEQRHRRSVQPAPASPACCQDKLADRFSIGFRRNDYKLAGM